MSSERLLGTLLRALQTHSAQQDTQRLLGTAISLYTTLNNPLNITVLTHQVLLAPAIWHQPAGLQTSLNMISLYHSAVHHYLKREEEAVKKALEDQGPTIWGMPQPVDMIKKERWVEAIMKGADDRVPAWKHCLVFAGLLVGFGPAEEERVSFSTRANVEQAFVDAANIALLKVREENDEYGAQSLSLAINHAFQLVSDHQRARLNYNVMLPVLMGSAFFSQAGLQSSYFIAPIDYDTVEEKAQDNRLHWPATSTSAQTIEGLLNSPLISALGPLSRLISHSAEQTTDPWLIQTMIEDIKNFSTALVKQWRNIRLSKVHAAEEAAKMTEDTIKISMFKLWKLLRSTLFAVIIILRGCMGRFVQDRILAATDVAPNLVVDTLHTLRNLYFISSRLGTESFSQYTFVYLTAIDILAQYPDYAAKFLEDARPMVVGSIPEEPLERALDLFFLNTSEHFTLILPPQINENLLVASAVPYLAAGGAADLLPSFEAAHSVMLAVMSAPQSAELTAKHLPFYVDSLFAVFPQNLSPRQFRLAFKTLLKVLAPPSSLTAMQPDLPAILLELLHHRALHASTDVLAPREATPSPLPSAPSPQFSALQVVSEQSVLVLTLLDSLPYLPYDLLEEWLPIAAELIHRIPDERMRESCKARFWDVIIGGDMDPDRSQICVAWWSTFGGRDLVLFGPAALAERKARYEERQREREKEKEEVMMSGALQPVAEPKESKL